MARRRFGQPSVISFNLSILECKFNHALRKIFQRLSFNLSILECKSVLPFPSQLLIFGFNLSILECKLQSKVTVAAETQVLIYPYWNVNVRQGDSRPVSVLF